MTSVITDRIRESIEVKERIFSDEDIISKIQKAGEIVRDALQSGNKVLLCGNGGSASDSLHIAGELVGRFQKERESFPAIALNADTASLTAIANDYGYEYVFERGVEGYGNSGDVLIGISTSGNSENVNKAIIKARERGLFTVGLSGKGGGKMNKLVDVSIVVPSDCTARIQESHIMIGHIICEMVDE
ncbi:MAG: D-sedoheptulose 7-phosphate isomerase [Butyrivibrio sp.]|nr:D-sedoheptulose 7-phosphate isomerase [Butyrivibrio sp.]